jgi:hypothetical protein
MHSGELKAKFAAPLFYSTWVGWLFSSAVLTWLMRTKYFVQGTEFLTVFVGTGAFFLTVVYLVHTILIRLKSLNLLGYFIASVVVAGLGAITTFGLGRNGISLFPGAPGFVAVSSSICLMSTAVFFAFGKWVVQRAESRNPGPLTD